MIEASAEIRGSAAELPLPLYKDNQRVDDTLLVSFRYRYIPL